MQHVRNLMLTCSGCHPMQVGPWRSKLKAILQCYYQFNQLLWATRSGYVSVWRGYATAWYAVAERKMTTILSGPSTVTSGAATTMTTGVATTTTTTTGMTTGHATIPGSLLKATTTGTVLWASPAMSQPGYEPARVPGPRPCPAQWWPIVAPVIAESAAANINNNKKTIKIINKNSKTK